MKKMRSQNYSQKQIWRMNFAFNESCNEPVKYPSHFLNDSNFNSLKIYSSSKTAELMHWNELQRGLSATPLQMAKFTKTVKLHSI